MENFLINDEIVRLLISKSSLSNTQFLAYLIKKNKINKKYLETIRDREKIFRTRGSLAGSFLQAKKNIRKSLYSLLLLFYLGVWNEKEERIIMSLIRGLKKVRDVDEHKKEDVASYIVAIIESMI